MNIIQFKIKSLIFRLLYQDSFTTKTERAIMFCYQELYKRAVPGANFLTLLDNAIRNNDKTTLSKHLYLVWSISNNDYWFRHHLETKNTELKGIPTAKDSKRLKYGNRFMIFRRTVLYLPFKNSKNTEVAS